MFCYAHVKMESQISYKHGPDGRGRGIENVTLLRYLIPDLANMVLEYCWFENEDIQGAAFYGNYEKLLLIICKLIDEPATNETSFVGSDEIPAKLEFAPMQGILYYLSMCAACKGGHVKIIQYFITCQGKRIIRGPDWITGLKIACLEGHKDVVQLLLPHFEKIPHRMISKGEHTKIVELLKPYRA